MRPRLRDIPRHRRRGPEAAAAGPFRREGERHREVGEPRVLAERHLAAGGADSVRQDQVGVVGIKGDMNHA